jgi:hypothetical protein
MSHVWTALRPQHHSRRPGPTSGRPSNVRNAPLATVGPKETACRDVPKATSASFTRCPLRLFDHLVGTHQQCLWNRNAHRICGLEVDHQLELGWLLDRDVGDLDAA